MEFTKGKSKDFYLFDTGIENIFINEYLPAAPGDYVKVYIYGYMYAEHGIRTTTEEMSQVLGMSTSDINKAWSYWEKAGAVKLKEIDPNGRLDPTIEFVSLKELMYGKVGKTTEASEEPEVNIFGNKEVKEMFDYIEHKFARNLSSTEMTDVLSWMEDDNIAPEVVRLGFDYSFERNKLSVKYVGKVVHSWHDDGLFTTETIEEHLADTDKRRSAYRRIISALGMGGRMPTEVERKMMDSWFDDLGYNMDKVLEACAKTSGISNPNFNYVNKVLENWSAESKKAGTGVNDEQVSQSTLNRYLAFLRDSEKSDADKRRKEVYAKVPRIREIDDLVSDLGTELSKDLLTGKDRKDAKNIQDKMDALAVERAAELTDHGFGPDHTDIRYKCLKCNDTGLTDNGERCTCIPERLKEAAMWIKTPEGKA